MLNEQDFIRQNEKKILGDVEKLKFIVRLHHNIYDEELLSEIFKREYFILSPTEKEILGMLIEGKTRKEVAAILEVKLKTVHNRVGDICMKYRTGQRHRVDNSPVLRYLRQKAGGK